jgi:rhodanese-related sulfurtransferase
MKKLLALLTLCIFLPLNVLAQNEGFPGRDMYPNVNFYETEQLNNNLDKVIIVDARSSYEYETLHINGAINIPLVSKDFVKNVRGLPTAGKDIVFYCNGHTCYKSYKAVLKARNAGVKNVYTYDAGIFDWANAHPDKSTLLGVTPINPSQLITKDKFKKHLLDPSDFSAKISDDTVILDIREAGQRGLLELYPYRQENIAMGQKEKLDSFLSKIKAQGKTLLAYDEAGKQVAWFQYSLEAKGITKYYFMKGGAKQFFKDIRKKK